MKIFLLGVISSILLVSCEKELIKKEIFFPNGNLKEIKYYDKKGKLKEGQIFHEDGNLFSEYVVDNKGNWVEVRSSTGKKFILRGKIDQFENRIGWWSFCNEDGLLLTKSEFVIVDKKQFLNQTVNYNEKGDILKKTSNYLFFSFPDTVKLGKPLKINFNHTLFDKKNIVNVICISDNLNSDFSNINDVEIDTIVTKNGFFKYTPKASGRKTKRGFLLQFYNDKSSEDNSVVSGSEFYLTKIYFERDVFVTE